MSSLTSAPVSSPMTTPSRRTTSRSEPSTTSSRSELMRMTARPLPARSLIERLDLGLGADVDAARGVVKDEQPRGGGQHAGEEHLLLVAARELGELLVWTRGLDAQPVDELLGEAPLVGADEQAVAGTAAAGS